MKLLTLKLVVLICVSMKKSARVFIQSDLQNKETMKNKYSLNEKENFYKSVNNIFLK